MTGGAKGKVTHWLPPHAGLCRAVGLTQYGAMNTVPSPASADDRVEEARRRILEASLAEFAAHGWGGARVDRIAAAAGINKRLLYVHMGNKEALWIAALEHVYATMRAGESELNLERLGPLEGLAMLVRFNFRFHAERPEFLRMLNEENRQGAAHLKKSDRVAAIYSPLLRLIRDILARGEAAGVIRAGLDPVQLYISIAALAFFYLSNSATLSVIFGRDLLSKAAKDERLDHMVGLVLAALTGKSSAMFARHKPAKRRVPVAHPA